MGGVGSHPPASGASCERASYPTRSTSESPRERSGSAHPSSKDTSVAKLCSRNSGLRERMALFRCGISGSKARAHTVELDRGRIRSVGALGSRRISFVEVLTIDYIVIMRRRFTALLSCLLALTFSTSGSRVCDSMAHTSGLDSTTHSASNSHEHHAPASSDSHHRSDHNGPLDHCPNVTSCAGVVVLAEALVKSIDCSHSNHVVQTVALAPASQSPDLEPPPPKA